MVPLYSPKELLLDHIGDILVDTLGLLLEHAVLQVGAVEAAEEPLAAGHLELVQDVHAHARVGRGRQRHDAGGREALAQDVQLLVVGPEVVAPLGHAVGLVYHESVEGDIESSRFSVYSAYCGRLFLLLWWTT